MSNPKFKIGDYVKQNPVGIVKKVIAIEPPDTENIHDKCFRYKLEDSFGWEPEYKLSLDKKENLSLSYDKAQQIRIESQQKKIKELEKKLAEAVALITEIANEEIAWAEMPRFCKMFLEEKEK